MSYGDECLSDALCASAKSLSERKMLDVGDVQAVIDKLQTRVAELEKENAKLRGNDEFWVGYHNIKSKLLR